MHEPEIDIESEELTSLIDVTEKYKDLGYFSEGGVAVIRKAQDKTLKRFVAVKSLKSQFCETPEMVDNFIVEAKVTAQLDHPSIIPLYSVNSDKKNGVHFAMKLINGVDFQQYIEKEKNNYACLGYSRSKERRALTVRLEHFLRVCDAVEYAHSRNVIHRDLKPNNIMIGSYNEVYLMDWGIAVLKNDDSNNELPKNLSGTPAYIAPELLDKTVSVNFKTDIYSLGVILFEVATMKKAFDSTDMHELFMDAIIGKTNPLTHYFKGIKISKDLKAIIRKAMNVDPAKRYNTVAELADDIRNLLMDEAVSARQETTLESAVRWMSKHRLKTFSGILCILLIFASISIVSLYKQKEVIKNSKKHQIILSELQSSLNHQGHSIDRYILHTQGILNVVAEKVISVLEDKEYKHEKLFSDKQFQKADTAPIGMCESPLYGMKLSLDYPVYKLSPGVKLEETREYIEKLFQLRGSFKKAIMSSIPGKPLTPENLKKLTECTLNTGMPMRWIYVGLDCGVLVSYPGHSGYNDAYDVRKRPWFTDVKNKVGVKWGELYVDASGQGLMLPCSVALRDINGKFLGAVGIDLSFDFLTETLMKKINSAVVEKYIVRKDGHILLTKSLQNYKEHGAIKNTTIKEPLFPHAGVRKALAKGRSGVIIDGDTIYIYSTILTIGHYLVAKVDRNILFNQK